MNPAADDVIRLTSLPRGAGCACKLPLAKLEELFASFGPGLAAASGDLLIGAIGTGVIATAVKNSAASGAYVQAAVTGRAGDGAAGHVRVLGGE